MRHKVNKNDFLTGLGSKVSLSDITNLTLDLNHEESIRMNQSQTNLLHSMEEELNYKMKEATEKMTQISKNYQEKLNEVFIKQT